MNEYEFELFQDGLRVAGSWGADRARVLADIQHYAMLYSQDGPVTIYEIVRCNGRKRRVLLPLAERTIAASVK